MLERIFLRLMCALLMLAGLAFCCAEADADITLGAQLAKNSGIGIGQKFELVSLQKNGTQDGGVSTSGIFGDAKSGNPVTFSALTSLGYDSSNFRLFLDLNQGNLDETEIESITLNFYNPNAAIPANPDFSISGGDFDDLEGSGGNSNWDLYFDVGFDAAEAAKFDDAANGNWQLGISVTDMDGASGQDVFGFSAVPEPSTVAIWSIFGSIGLFVAWRKRRRAA